jgi:hypothetical protein
MSQDADEPTRVPAGADPPEADRPPARHQPRLPGFLVDEEIGLGDLIKKATASAGIGPCGGCARRGAALNRWMTFRPRR